MPEGDTIWRTAQSLHSVFTGRIVTAFHSPLPEVAAAAQHWKLVGRKILDVEARGKHLLIHFSDGTSLHTHLRMTGSWHIYRHGSRWRKDARTARAVIETEEAVAVCFSAPLVSILPPGRARSHPSLAGLGPDLLAPGFDEEEALRRLRARGSQEIGVALMDQTALAGIGNVYKSEVLFACGVHPFARVARLDDASLRRLIGAARAQMQSNLGPGMRRTRPQASSGRLWVYGRSGRPCYRCGTAIRRRVQGEQARATFWCPLCQSGTAACAPSGL